MKIPTLAALVLAATSTFSSVHAQQAPATPIISNGNFETDENADGAPDDWGQAKGPLSFETENGNHFARLTSQKPGQMALLYRLIPIPANTKALELTYKQRVTGLKPGKQSWFDARIMMEWKDAAGQKMKGAPSPPYTRKDTDGWVEKSASFLVPEGATTLEFMPSLFQVQSGTFDLDDFVLKPTDPAPLEVAAKEYADKKAVKNARDAQKRAEKIAKTIGADGSFFLNGDLQSDADGDGVPDAWGKPKEGSGVSYETEGDNRFLRLKSPEPFKMVLMYRAIDLPADAKAVELSWKERITGLKRGKLNFHDARIMSDWNDANFKKVKGGPALTNSSKDTDGWVEKSKSLLVPEGVSALALMPTLFQVESGTFDLDDFKIKATDPALLVAAQAAADEEQKRINIPVEAPNPAKFPSELHVVGNKIINKQGQPVLLSGVNIDSLQWSVRGERVMLNTRVAIEDWKSKIIRLPVKEDYWAGTNAEQKDGGASYRELVDNIITLAANRGAYVLLDLHRFRAPTRAHVEFWKIAAAKYKDNPAVLFEIFNEPHGMSWEIWRNGGFVEDKNAPADEDAFLTPEEKALNAKGFHSVGMQALVDAVRGTGAKNIIVAGGLDWAYDLSGIAKGFALDDKSGNLMYSTHIYAGKRDWQNKVLVVADKYPIIVSEFGANTQKFTFMPAESQEDAATWVPRVFGFIQKNNLNWTAFSFHPKSGPHILQSWDYTPTPEWGAFVKRALAGEKFPDQGMR